MLPAFLLPEIVTRQNGEGAEVNLASRRPVLLTLGITRVLQQENLEVSVCGAAPGGEWHELCSFPQKSYCGTYTLPLDLTAHKDVTRLRVEWRMSRWSGAEAPLFGFHVRAEEAKLRKHAGAG